MVPTGSFPNKASLKGVAFSVQAEQGLWSAMQSHTDEAQVANGTPFLFVDLTAARCLSMWRTPDQIGGKFHLRDDQEWALRGGQTIPNLQELGRALKSATASTNAFVPPVLVLLKLAHDAAIAGWKSVGSYDIFRPRLKQPSARQTGLEIIKMVGDDIGAGCARGIRDQRQPRDDSPAQMSRKHASRHGGCGNYSRACGAGCSRNLGQTT